MQHEAAKYTFVTNCEGWGAYSVKHTRFPPEHTESLSIVVKTAPTKTRTSSRLESNEDWSSRPRQDQDSLPNPSKNWNAFVCVCLYVVILLLQILKTSNMWNRYMKLCSKEKHYKVNSHENERRDIKFIG